MILYADIYILINAFCDFLALWSCGKLLSLKIKYIRLVFASLFLAVYAFIIILFNLNSVLKFFMNIICLMFSSAIAYGFSSIPGLLRTASVFFINCLMIGGVASWIIGFSKVRLIIIICLTPLIYFAWLCISKTALSDMKIKTIKVQTEKNTLCGLVDSGNLLTEPQSGLCVIVANKTLFNGEIPPECLKIKVQTASGDAYLPCFKPKYLKVGNKEVDAMIALNEQDKLDYDCIVPISLID